MAVSKGGQVNPRKRVLILDDDHDTLDLLELFLFREFDVLTALNGFEGLRKAQEFMPDVIMTDIMMPVMNGISFINNLKKHAATSSIPVIAVTSFSEKHPIKSLMNIGFQDVITKPFVKEDVERSLTGIVYDAS
ncbi:MAG: response regulator [Chitinivibrionales bacterium]|nr:response regulator [Chitinivibrionales bacterium]